MIVINIILKEKSIYMYWKVLSGVAWQIYKHTQLLKQRRVIMKELSAFGEVVFNGYSCSSIVYFLIHTYIEIYSLKYHQVSSHPCNEYQVFFFKYITSILLLFSSWNIIYCFLLFSSFPPLGQYFYNIFHDDGRAAKT